jgi:hypothetical protein
LKIIDNFYKTRIAPKRGPGRIEATLSRGLNRRPGEQLVVNPDVILGHLTIGEPLFEFATTARKGDSLLFAYFGKIDLADYLHRDRSSVIGGSDLIVSGALSALSFSSSLLVCQRFLFFCRPNTDPAGDE